MNKIIIPIIRNVSPISLEEICSVQPMIGNTEINQLYQQKIVQVDFDCEGDKRHSLLEGWQVFYNGEWIAEATWLKLKIAGL